MTGVANHTLLKLIEACVALAWLTTVSKRFAGLLPDCA
jgi:hypothetical protein